MKLKFSVFLWALLLCGVSLAAFGKSAPAGSIGLSNGAGGTFNVGVVSIREARFKGVIKQQYDFSCGSAALATLLKYHYGRPVTEKDVFAAMYAAGDQEKIRKLGFSLLDMQRHLKTHGLQADGYKLTLDKIAEVGVPAIVLINTSGYKHFVVVKGVSEAEVVIGDPAMGMKVMQRDAFEEIWNNVAFLIRNEASVGRDHFNLAEDWSVRVRAPFGTALSRQALSSFTIHMPTSSPF